jgi:hypothetical protein
MSIIFKELLEPSEPFYGIHNFKIIFLITFRKYIMMLTNMIFLILKNHEMCQHLDLCNLVKAVFPR